MKEPKRIYEEKYKRMLELSERVRVNRPAEGEIIHRLILHVQEMYDYVDYLQGTELGMDDNALDRLGVPEARTPEATPARSGNRRRRGNRDRLNPRTNRPSFVPDFVGRTTAEDGWQAQPTDLEWMNGIDEDEEIPF
jgi:hypothetical protein